MRLSCPRPFFVSLAILALSETFSLYLNSQYVNSLDSVRLIERLDPRPSSARHAFRSSRLPAP